MSAKHIFTTLAAFALFLASSGCNAQNKQENTNAKTQSNNKTMNTIVIFFSHAGDNYVVGDNGANYITNLEVGNTKIVADYISEITGADQYEIVMRAPVCGEETQDDVRVSPCCDQEQLRHSLQMNLD